MKRKRILRSKQATSIGWFCFCCRRVLRTVCPYASSVGPAGRAADDRIAHLTLAARASIWQQGTEPACIARTSPHGIAFHGRRGLPCLTRQCSAHTRIERSRRRTRQVSCCSPVQSPKSMESMYMVLQGGNPSVAHACVCFCGRELGSRNSWRPAEVVGLWSSGCRRAERDIVEPLSCSPRPHPAPGPHGLVLCSLLTRSSARHVRFPLFSGSSRRELFGCPPR